MLQAIATTLLAFSPGPRLGKDVLTGLQRNGFAVVPDFVTSNTVEALKRDVALLHREGRFSTAGVGEMNNRVDGLVRKCEQCFVFPQFKHKGGGDAHGRSMLYESIDSLRADLTAGCGVELDGMLTEGLYATYPNGGFYRRHVDSVPGTASDVRQWSYLLYLNTEWKEEDGGCLRVFEPHETSDGSEGSQGERGFTEDILPEGGTLALLMSRDVEHLVRETSAERQCIVGWFREYQEARVPDRDAMSLHTWS